MRPACRIRSSSSRFLSVTAIYFQGARHGLSNQRNFALAINLDQVALFAIVFNQWPRLSEVYLQTMPRCLHRIIVTLIQLPAARIAHIRSFGWKIIYVVNIPAGLACLPASD